MNLSAPFIRRPVATTLMVIWLICAGLFAYPLLPTAPMPDVDYPVISVSASLPGASPEIVAQTVASPLERHLGQIADVNEMTSSSSSGSARITLQFGLNRDIDGAARDVQAAINAARADLPADLRSNPTYRKVNPADAPILILALTSDTMTPGQIYDTASTVLAQKLLQVDGIGDVTIGGGSLPAVRVELNPDILNQYGIGLEDVRAALSAANAHAPKGALSEGRLRFQIYANDQSRHAADYQNLIVAWRNGAPVRLSDLGEVMDSVENARTAGFSDGKPAVLLTLFRAPGANIVATVDRIHAMLPALRAAAPAAIDIRPAIDRSTTIRASLSEVQHTLALAVLLVIAVVFAFLRDWRAAAVPVVAVPVSLIGTLGAMYLFGFSIDNLSLMALTVATGFVVDDAIVVLENIERHRRDGLRPVEAALLGAREVGFTVLSMSLSLVAVFIPILLMDGIVGKIFREFALTVSTTIALSLVISVTATPMMCARFLRPEGERPHGRLFKASEAAFTKVIAAYGRTLGWALDRPKRMLGLFVLTIVLTGTLYQTIPKGFFPQQDTGRLVGAVVADQASSSAAMKQKLHRFIEIIRKDPSVDTVAGFFNAGQGNVGMIFVSLKPLASGRPAAPEIIARLRGAFAPIPGASLYMQSVQDIRMGGRASNAQFQYTLQGDDYAELSHWAQRLTQALMRDPRLTEVNSDQQAKGLQTDVEIDRDAAKRLGLSLSQIDNTLYDAFGQRQVSTIYAERNQYHVVMELAPQFIQDPGALGRIYVATGQTSTEAARNAQDNAVGATGRGASSTGSAISTSERRMIPLSAVAAFAPGTTPLAVNHQGLFVATTLSFNLAAGAALSDAVSAVADAQNAIGMPTTIHGSFAGTAQAFKKSLSSQPLLILAAVVAVYLVLGILYESFAHPLTILSTLPSAGLSALASLHLFGAEFNVMSLIGLLLLIGIVMKNAIMMIDVALETQRSAALSARAAIHHACMLRFRPILMTTLAALFGAVPLAIGFGEGSELRQPLGMTIVGGLAFSQILTLYTTPAMFLWVDRMQALFRRKTPAPPASAASPNSSAP